MDRHVQILAEAEEIHLRPRRKTIFFSKLNVDTLFGQYVCYKYILISILTVIVLFYQRIALTIFVSSTVIIRSS